MGWGSGQGWVPGALAALRHEENIAAKNHGKYNFLNGSKEFEVGTPRIRGAFAFEINRWKGSTLQGPSSTFFRVLLDSGGFRSIQKPFDLRGLAVKVREVLDEAGAAGEGRESGSEKKH